VCVRLRENEEKRERKREREREREEKRDREGGEKRERDREIEGEREKDTHRERQRVCVFQPVVTVVLPAKRSECISYGLPQLVHLHPIFIRSEQEQFPTK
jgi:hypothetical protein